MRELMKSSTNLFKSNFSSSKNITDKSILHSKELDSSRTDQKSILLNLEKINLPVSISKNKLNKELYENLHPSSYKAKDNIKTK